MVKNPPANAGDPGSISLIWEDPTCLRATKLMHHTYWACALKPGSHNYWAYWSPHTLYSPCSSTRETTTVRSLWIATRKKSAQQWRLSTIKNKQIKLLKEKNFKLMMNLDLSWLSVKQNSNSYCLTRECLSIQFMQINISALIYKVKWGMTPQGVKYCCISSLAPKVNTIFTDHFNVTM